MIVYGGFTECFTMYPDSGYNRTHAQSVCTRPFFLFPGLGTRLCVAWSIDVQTLWSLYQARFFEQVFVSLSWLSACCNGLPCPSGCLAYFFISLPPLVWTGGYQTLSECHHIQWSWWWRQLMLSSSLLHGVRQSLPSIRCELIGVMILLVLVNLLT